MGGKFNKFRNKHLDKAGFRVNRGGKATNDPSGLDREGGLAEDDFEDFDDEEEEEPTTECFRIGRQPGYDLKPLKEKDGTLEAKAVVVAFVDPEGEIEYHSLYAWEVNGNGSRMAGAYDSALVLGDIFEMYPNDTREGEVDHFVPDEYFERCMEDETLEVALKALAKGGRHKSLPHKKTGVTIMETPIQGVLQEGVKLPLGRVLDMNRERPIQVVFEFVNHGATEGLELPVNSQVELSQKDTYKTFETFVKKCDIDEGQYAGKTIHGMLTTFRFYCELEIWVLPQGSQGNMYSWTEQPDLRGADFLDGAISDKVRNLYVQVCIKPQTGEKLAEARAEWEKSGGSASHDSSKPGGASATSSQSKPSSWAAKASAASEGKKAKTSKKSSKKKGRAPASHQW